MKKIFLSLLALFLPVFLWPGDILAANTIPNSTLKEYCTLVEVRTVTYDAIKNELKISMDATMKGLETDKQVTIGIKQVELQGSNNTVNSFNVNQSYAFTSFDPATKVRFTVPVNTFIKDATKNSTTDTRFDVKVTDEATQQGGSTGSGGQDSVVCYANSTSPLVVQPQSQQQVAPDNPNKGGVSQPLDIKQNFQLDYCDNNQTKIYTAIGCIPIRTRYEFASWILGWIIGISGGIAFLMIVFSGIKIMTASGNPDQLQSGQEMLTAALSGLILIIFSVVLLKLIGIDILHIPGLV